MEPKDKLTAQQRIFVAEYLKDKNATQAAKRANYSEKTAYSQGQRLLKKVEVAEAIEAGIKAQEKRVLISADRVLLELKRIALLDIGEAYGPDNELLPIRDIPKDIRRAIAGVEVEELWEGFGEDRQHVGQTKKLKLNDKLRALELLGKHLKLFTDKIEITDNSSLADRMKKARERLVKK